jgi:hypothetical protein
MSTQLSDDEIRKKAVERVRAKKGFFTHLSVYLAVNVFLWVIWAMTTSPWGFAGGMHNVPAWPLFATVGWGIGLVIHCLSVFALHGGWEDQQVQKEIEKIKKSSS